MPSKAQECWLPVPGYEGLYEVSGQGRVKSCARVVDSVNMYGPIRKPVKERMLIFGSAKGYPTVSLSLDGKVTAFTVHRLVMTTFVGERPEGHQIAHGDGDPLNNRLDNLRYATPTENSADMVGHGTLLRGQHIGTSKLTERDVREIKRLEGEITRHDLAAMYGVCYATISHIANGRSWNHIA